MSVDEHLSHTVFLRHFSFRCVRGQKALCAQVRIRAHDNWAWNNDYFHPELRATKLSLLCPCIILAVNCLLGGVP